MDYDNIGRFVLIDKNQTIYPLCYETSIVSVNNNKITVGKFTENAASFLIDISEDGIKIKKLKGNLKINNNIVSDSTRIEDDTEISIDNNVLHFKFLYEETKLETIIDLYMDGNLDFSINMERCFLEYAKILKITDRKAISNMMAVIDIPEIDKI